jgi:aldose 1-epimerase
LEKEIEIKSFGSIQGIAVNEYTLSNENGMRVSFLNYGGTVTKIMTPDKNGVLGNVILGLDCLDDYLQPTNPFLGSLIGRYANRIGGARFTLNDCVYKLNANDHDNTLHGGIKGFDKVIWEAQILPAENAVRLQYISEDGEEGFPGKLHSQVKYTLTQDNAFVIEYLATTNAPTPVCLTSHAYFNLSAGEQDTILNHELCLHANQFIPVNEKAIPTGKMVDVQNTPMDFTSPKLIGTTINNVKGGYDHSWVLNKNKQAFYKNNQALVLAAEVNDAASGRFLSMYTTEPAVQMYTGNYLDGSFAAQNGKWIFKKQGALCLEAQHYPDSPNQPHFPNTILHPGETYAQTTVYQFSVKP